MFLCGWNTWIENCNLVLVYNEDEKKKFQWKHNLFKRLLSVRFPVWNTISNYVASFQQRTFRFPTGIQNELNIHFIKEDSHRSFSLK